MEKGSSSQSSIDQAASANRFSGYLLAHVPSPPIGVYHSRRWRTAAAERRDNIYIVARMRSWYYTAMDRPKNLGLGLSRPFTAGGQTNL